MLCASTTFFFFCFVFKFCFVCFFFLFFFFTFLSLTLFLWAVAAWALPKVNHPSSDVSFYFLGASTPEKKKQNTCTQPDRRCACTFPLCRVINAGYGSSCGKNSSSSSRSSSCSTSCGASSSSSSSGSSSCTVYMAKTS